MSVRLDRKDRGIIAQTRRNVNESGKKLPYRSAIRKEPTAKRARMHAAKRALSWAPTYGCIQMSALEYLASIVFAVGFGMFVYGGFTDQIPWVFGGWLLALVAVGSMEVRKRLQTGEWSDWARDD